MTNLEISLYVWQVSLCCMLMLVYIREFEQNSAGDSVCAQKICTSKIKIKNRRETKFDSKFMKMP